MDVFSTIDNAIKKKKSKVDYYKNDQKLFSPLKQILLIIKELAGHTTIIIK